MHKTQLLESYVKICSALSFSTGLSEVAHSNKNFKASGQCMLLSSSKSKIKQFYKNLLESQNVKKEPKIMKDV